MILYVVHGNTYYNDYGHIEKIFGVYTEKDAAEAAKDLVTQELYEKNVNDKWTRVENLSDVDVDILEIEADKLVEIELANIYRQRKGHKLDEWREVCKWIETLPYSELITGLSIGSDQSITEKRFTRPFPWIKEDDVYCNNCEHFHDCLNKGGLVDVTTGNDITKDRYINKPGYDCPKGEEHE